MRVDLIRIEQSPEGTFGVLKIAGKAFCITLENPWFNNKPEISCIPEGVYLCRKTLSSIHGETFTVLDVPGRSHILFHSGNLIKDTQGCILLGQSFGLLEEKRAILNSKDAVNNFLERLKNTPSFALNIQKAC